MSAKGENDKNEETTFIYLANFISAFYQVKTPKNKIKYF